MLSSGLFSVATDYNRRPGGRFDLVFASAGVGLRRILFVALCAPTGHPFSAPTARADQRRFPLGNSN